MGSESARAVLVWIKLVEDCDYSLKLLRSVGFRFLVNHNGNWLDFGYGN